MKGKSVKQLQGDLKNKTAKIKKLGDELKKDKAGIGALKKAIADGKKAEAAAKKTKKPVKKVVKKVIKKV